MFGFVNEALESFIRNTHGDAIWDKAKLLANCLVPFGGWVINENFPDDITLRLVIAATQILDANIDEVLEGLGHYILIFAR
jgi:hypothetical protein